MSNIEAQYTKTFKKVPKAPIQNLTRSFNNFTKKNTSSGFLVIGAVIVALIIANTALSNDYFLLLKTPFIIGVGEILIDDSILHWINDGLMTIFFFLIGLEIKREVLIGELNSIKHATFPFIGAIGGMLFPALIYTIFNPPSSLGSHGWAIPTATDIAFSLVVLTLLGTRIPLRLKIFLTTLAIFDDIGAIFIIAIFYTSTIH